MSNRNASLSPAVALRSGDIVVAQRAYISIAQVGDTGIVVDAPASMRCHPGTLVLVTNGGYITIEAEDVKPTGHRLEGASFELCNAARVSGTLERIVLSDKTFAETGQSIRVHLLQACEHKIALQVDAAISVVDTDPTEAESWSYEAGKEAWEFDIQVPNKLHPFPSLSAAFRRGFDEIESHSQRQVRPGVDPFDQSQHDRPRGG